MFLERIVINGFKSFADKTVLEFLLKENKSFGITAIVGPNGSGKSNIVEAIRWGLGEQSLKILRCKKSEDIIFSGSEKRARLNLAEVSLYFNNEDRKAPIDYTQFTVTRRLYRNNESEYLLNNNKVKLQDILILLAQANFGQKSFSIIGQGMIDSILYSSPSERKNFFEEATGIKQYQIKKEEALRKLEKTKVNLSQAETALAELEPRLRSLTRQIKKLERREKLEEELKILEKRYYGGFWQKIENQLSNLNDQIEEILNKKGLIENELNQLQKKFEEMIFEKTEAEYENFQNEQQKLIELKNKYLEELSNLKTKYFIEKEKFKTEKKLKKIDYEKVLEELKKIKDFYKELLNEIEKVKSVEDLPKIKNFALEVLNEIDSLISYLSREEKEEKFYLIKFENEIKEINQKIEEIDKKIKDYSQKILELTKKGEEKRKVFFEFQKKIQDKQNVLIEINKNLNNLLIEKARVETQKENLEFEIKRENLNIEEIINFKEKEKDFEILYPEIQKIKHQLELIGGIDPEIVKEYPLCKERWDFLTTQIKDLKSALSSLNKIINELNERIEKQFNQVFNKINEKFDYYFKVFFNGGKAKLILNKKEKIDNEETSQNESEFESIEIFVNLPKKKLKNIEALSGGERALTCLALICAIIAVNQPPFVVLDEVDAALDEENSSRFANIIKDLANQTQFIIITHNRQTMEVADILYGVTIDKDGVSKILSLRF
jgi:chromosome segregation protein